MNLDFRNSRDSKPKLGDVFGPIPLFAAFFVIILQMSLWLLIYFAGSSAYKTWILLGIDVFSACFEDRKPILISIYSIMFPVSFIMISVAVATLIRAYIISRSLFVFSSAVCLLFGIPLIYLLFSENIFIPEKFLSAACKGSWFLPVIFVQPIIYSVCVYFIVGVAKVVFTQRAVR